MTKIKRLGVMKMAYFGALFNFFAGIIFTIFWFILLFLFASLFGSLMSSSVSAPGFVEMLPLLFFPFVAAIGGFFSGLILTPILNLCLRIIGGLQIDIQEEMVPQLN